MKSLKYLTLFLMVGILFSCTKKNDTPDPEVLGSMTDIVVASDFNWSAGLLGQLNISFVNPNNVSLEREYVQIIDEQGNVLDRTMVYDSSATFYIQLAQDATYYVYFPVTNDMKAIESLGNITMELGETVEYIYPNFKSTRVVTCTACDSPLVNAGGEDPYLASGYTIINESQVPGWQTTATDNKIEIWASGFQGVPAQEGHQFFELNANQVASLYQELCLEPGSTIYWSVWHRGRSGVDVADVKIGATVETAEFQATMTDGKTAWGYYSGSYNVPLGQTTTVFVFESISATGGNRSYGNFLDNFEISCDFDGDGIIDRWDDLPEDPDAAYITHFPESGKQIVAFEDLWPSYGDFDFNDLILSNQVIITSNGSGTPLEASFKVSIDAIGASLDNGFAMMLYDENKAAFTENIISEITGDASLDPDNTNGLIISNDVFETINDRYQNNGEGPEGVPDTLRFTITFNENAAAFIPELYLFRTNDRGHEVHRSGFPLTETANPALFNTEDDAGDYKSATGLPWGIEILTDQIYQNPIEKVDILIAYPKFGSWATSNGVTDPLWYQEPVSDKVVDIDFGL